MEFLCSQGPSVANDYVGENSVLKTENLEASIIEIAKNDKVDTIEKINRRFTKIKKNKAYTRDYEM